MKIAVMWLLVSAAAVQMIYGQDVLWQEMPSQIRSRDWRTSLAGGCLRIEGQGRCFEMGVAAVKFVQLQDCLILQLDDCGAKGVVFLTPRTIYRRFGVSVKHIVEDCVWLSDGTCFDVVQRSFGSPQNTSAQKRLRYLNLRIERLQQRVAREQRKIKERSEQHALLARELVKQKIALQAVAAELRDKSAALQRISKKLTELTPQCEILQHKVQKLHTQKQRYEDFVKVCEANLDSLYQRIEKRAHRLVQIQEGTSEENRNLAAVIGNLVEKKQLLRKMEGRLGELRAQAAQTSAPSRITASLLEKPEKLAARLATIKTVTKFHHFGSRYLALEFSADRAFAVLQYGGNRPKLLALGTSQAQDIARSLDICAWAPNPDTPVALACASGHTLKFYGGPDLQIILSREAPQKITALCWDPTGKKIYFTTKQGIYSWDFQAFNPPKREIAGNFNLLRSSPQGYLAAYSPEREALIIFDEKRQPVIEHKMPEPEYLGFPKKHTIWAAQRRSIAYHVKIYRSSNNVLQERLQFATAPQGDAFLQMSNGFAGFSVDSGI